MTQEERMHNLESQLRKALSELREVKVVLRKLGHPVSSDDITDGMEWKEVLLQAVRGNTRFLHAWYRAGKRIPKTLEG